MTEWNVRPVTASDEQEWRELYRGYRAFYGVPADEAKIDTVWSWLSDEAHESHGFVAVDAEGQLGGIAHVRRFARPLSATTGLYLDDLFTSPAVRGGGAGRALLLHLGEYAEDAGLSVVRWITAADNSTARRLYDSVAKQTAWVTYDIVS
ncbi:GNAT family N-acetyltransferase [Pseudoclavibacter sp. VKM Ac-2888]|uniref:GNAT family N-acetyltransferase n=1 Tax=Pseudoclavibacter sp. VKM Ac-2888 TaxID=2783830 RepID=UPI00188AA5C5|nr:GNAT family N-acetyltransferase [Pseudoclavibacter sp. VKM Ac-2888]MBF4551865.1 GNAT family N-acetyltransferase [Pseudoclavibacter sp. VKM Ac-2888]